MNRDRATPTDVVMRALVLTYIGLLILLPMTALTSEAFREGWATVLNEIRQPQALAALRLTCMLAAAIVVLNVITGTATAWVLVRYTFPGKAVLNTLIDLPFAIPTVVTGIMLVTLYGPNSLIGALLQRCNLGIIFSIPGIILALLFVTLPFVIRTVQPVLLEMDRDMEEAARTLGAGPVYIFRRIIIPTLLPAILTGAALSFSRALGEFGSVVIVAGNIPFKTMVAPVYVYGEIESANIPGATGVSLVLLSLSFAVLVLLHFVQRWSRRHEEAA